MPRKIKTPASVAQNRESQRRARARQREMMETMRKQLDQYERRGVEASLEMQNAARAVARENRRLHLMLVHRGVRQDEIEAFLRLPDNAVEKMAIGEAIPQPRPPVVAMPATSYGCNSGWGIDMHGQIASQASPSTATTTLTELDTSLETPCTVGADIISQLCGHKDAAETLMALGCSGTAAGCTVKNTKLLQLIDDMV